MSMSRPSIVQDVIWRLEAFAFDAMTFTARLWPVAWVSAFGGFALRKLGPLTGAHKVADRNIRLAFPDMTSQARHDLLIAQWDNLGRTFLEFPLADRITPASGRVEVIGRERLVAIAESGRSAVLVGGHFANWEVLGTAIVDSGLKCSITYRAANNPYVDKRIIEGRARYGVRLFAPKGGLGSRELLATLKGGDSVAFMNDQKFNGGVAAPFFGRMVHSAGAPTRLALNFGAQLQPMSVVRLPGARFRVTVDEPIILENTGNRERDVEAGVRAINAYIEAGVRANPSQWFWVHKRWPQEAYAELAQADALKAQV